MTMHTIKKQLVGKQCILAVAVLCMWTGLSSVRAQQTTVTAPATSGATSTVASLDYRAFANIPVLDKGRVKPLETFARTYLLALCGRQRPPASMRTEIPNAVAWLAETLFDSQRAYQRRVFRVLGSDTRDALSLPPRTGHLYSFNELSPAVANIADTVQALHGKPLKSRTPLQNRLVETSLRVLWYAELSRALSLLVPNYKVRSEAVARTLQLTRGVPYTYLELLRVRTTIAERARPLLDATRDGDDTTDNAGDEDLSRDLNTDERELLALALYLSRIEKHGNNRIFPDVLRVIPPLWGDGNAEWLSPWTLVLSGQGAPASADLFASWSTLARAWRAHDVESWTTASEHLHKEVLSAAALNPLRLAVEVLYGRLQLFDWSLVLYLLALLALGVHGFITNDKKQRREYAKNAASFFLCTGALFHFVAMAMRSYILLRPPVATLYESIVFVALVAVIFCLFLIWKTRASHAIFIGALIGSVLLLISRGYADEGDTMEILVAVLNTNFWLATHVLMMTSGYAFALAGGVCGHLYLLRSVFAPDDVKLRTLHANMVGITLFAAFFAVFGTILGGIWADQSWGRFWGWDPKENGALLLVLWLLLLLHAHIARVVSARGYALGMVCTNIIVALAWFGVNLLNVGLHSYGFTENIALNLALFCSGELLFGVVFYFLSKRAARVTS